jgi:hypothetical protein
VEQKDMPNLEIVAVEDAELENESKLEQKQRPRLLTRRRIVDYVLLWPRGTQHPCASGRMGCSGTVQRCAQKTRSMNEKPGHF